MSKLRIFLLAFAALCPLLPACAQGLVQFPAAPAAWTVDVVPYNRADPTKPPDKAPEVKKIDITKVGEVSRNVITWVSGKPTERWCFDKLQIMAITDTYNGAPAFMNGEDILMGGEYAVGFDASAFSWLKDEYLKDVVPYHGKKCNHYQGTVMVQHTESTPTGIKVSHRPLYCEAWVDKDTLLPVALFDGNKLGVFTFHDPPTGPLNLPKALQKHIDHYIAASKPLK